MSSVVARSRFSVRCLRTLATPSFRHAVALSQRRTPISLLAPRGYTFRQFSSLPRLQDASVAAQIEPIVDSPGDAPVITKFAELGQRNVVCQTVVDTLTQDMGLETMTPVQVQTINECISGADVIAQARTGTGKTLAFLTPILQRIINDDPMLGKRTPNNQKGDIRALIISPTRELAEQIAEEARRVTRNTGIVVQTAVGGTQKRASLQKIQRHGCHILVGTPGRLNDLLSDPHSDVRAPNLRTLVLDEADRLLDQGFGPEIQRIEGLLPRKDMVDRQTLMFSATVPEEVMYMVESFMKPDYSFIQTVQPGEQQTHERVPQKLVELNGFENMTAAIMELANREVARGDAESPFKAIVFFNANAEATLAAATFHQASRKQRAPYTTVEMHSRLTQYQRTRNAEQFRKSRSAIMFSSDVTARGMDFPGVTHVIQAGLPLNQDTYVHRLGRTARGGKQGEGWILLTPAEVPESKRRLKDMPLQTDTSLQTAQVDMTQEAQLPQGVASILTKAVEASVQVDPQVKADAYKATLGYFQWYPRKQRLIDMMNNRAKFAWGMSTPPVISQKLVSKLNLKSIEGLNVGSDYDLPQRGYQRGGGRESRGFGARGDRAGRDGGFRGRGDGADGRRNGGFRGRGDGADGRRNGGFRGRGDGADGRRSYGAEYGRENRGGPRGGRDRYGEYN